MERLSSEADIRHIVFMGKQLMYYLISRAFINIPSIIILYSFPNLKKQKSTKRLTMLKVSPCYKFAYSSFPKWLIALLNALVIPLYIILRSLDIPIKGARSRLRKRVFPNSSARSFRPQNSGVNSVATSSKPTI